MHADPPGNTMFACMDNIGAMCIGLHVLIHSLIIV